MSLSRAATAISALGLLTLTACPIIGDSLLVIEGELVGLDKISLGRCDLNLHIASDKSILDTQEIGGKFSAHFVVSPFDEFYFISILCADGENMYVSEELEFEPKNGMHKEELGQIVF